MNDKRKKIIIGTVCVLCSFFVCFSATVVVGGIINKLPEQETKSASNKSTKPKKKEEKTDKKKDKLAATYPSEAATDVTGTTQPITEPITQPATEVATEYTTEWATEQPTLSATWADDSLQPPELTFYLSDNDYSYDSLKELNCNQLIVVTSAGNNANVQMYEKNDEGIWVNQTALATSGYVGSNGVSSESYEGSRETPAGLFPVGEAFYRNIKPNTGLDSFEITPDTYWVDDPDSEFYNKRVVGTESMDWNSAEEMYSYTSYEYGFVIDFNMNPIIPKKGSAIFFHISYAPTAGCVGVSEQMVLNYLSVLDADKNPYILIM